ncbi:MAG: M42 family metallopeptidase [Syntrophobacteraceae bacterium]
MDDRTASDALELLEKLSQAHGAPGLENEVRRIFRSELGDGVTTDRAGDIICEVKGTSDSPRIMVAAHMDEVGLMVQSVTSAGLLRFVPLGGWWAHVLPAKRVRVRTRDGSEVVGVIGAKPPHFLSEAERDKLLKIEDMYIDIGARSAEEALGLGVRVGDPIVPDSPFTRMANPDCLLSKAFDDRAGLALVVQAARILKSMNHPNTVFAAGTVQEEVGTRGAKTAAHYIDPDIAIVVESAPGDDSPGLAEEERQSAMGKGVQIRFMDPSTLTNRGFTEFVIETAEKNNIRHQMAVRRKGGTDASPIHMHGAGVPTVVIAVPARYAHTHNTIIALSDYLAALRLILKLIETIDEKVASGFWDFSR